MPYVMLRFRVSDFQHWKNEFTANVAWRRQHGEKGYHIYRDANDPDMLTLLEKIDTVENADRFLNSPELDEKLKRAGVVGVPETAIMEAEAA
ncbi:MAG: cyclase [Armatimonadota bacterium]